MFTLERLANSERQAPRNRQNLAGSPAIRKLSAAMAALLLAVGCGDDPVSGPAELGGTSSDGGGRRGDGGSLDGGGFGAAQDDATATAADSMIDTAVVDTAADTAADTASDATATLATDTTASADAGVADTTADTRSPADTATDATATSTADTAGTTDSSDSGATDVSVAETAADTKADATTSIDATVITPNDAVPETDTYAGPVPADMIVSKDTAVNPTTPEGKCLMALKEYSDKKGDETCEEAGVPGVPGSGYKGTMKCVKGNDAPTCVTN